MRIEVNKHIVVDTEICGGTPTFSGTRIMVWQVIEMLETGESNEEIIENYPTLTKEHIRAALKFAREKLSGDRIIAL